MATVRSETQKDRANRLEKRDEALEFITTIGDDDSRRVRRKGFHLLFSSAGGNPNLWIGVARVLAIHFQSVFPSTWRYFRDSSRTTSSVMEFFKENLLKEAECLLVCKEEWHKSEIRGLHFLLDVFGKDHPELQELLRKIAECRSTFPPSVMEKLEVDGNSSPSHTEDDSKDGASPEQDASETPLAETEEKPGQDAPNHPPEKDQAATVAAETPPAEEKPGKKSARKKPPVTAVTVTKTPKKKSGKKAKPSSPSPHPHIPMTPEDKEKLKSLAEKGFKVTERRERIRTKASR